MLNFAVICGPRSRQTVSLFQTQCICYYVIEVFLSGEVFTKMTRQLSYRSICAHVFVQYLRWGLFKHRQCNKILIIPFCQATQVSINDTKGLFFQNGIKRLVCVRAVRRRGRPGDRCLGVKNINQTKRNMQNIH